jgi:hypothetical protein
MSEEGDSGSGPRTVDCVKIDSGCDGCFEFGTLCFEVDSGWG